MKTRKYYLQLTCLTFLLFFKIINAQNYSLYPADILHIDSLMFNGQFEKTDNFFKNRDEQLKNIYITVREYERYSKIKNQCFEVISFIESIYKMDTLELSQFINQYNRFESAFEKQTAGQKASELYEKYSTKVKMKEYAEAIKFYQIARYFKIKHIKRKKETISAALNQAYKDFTELKFHESQRHLSTADSLCSNVIIKDTVLDSIDYLYNKLSHHFNKEMNYKNMWENEEVSDALFNINLGFGITTQNALHNTYISMIRKDVPIPDKDLPTRYRYKIEYLPPANRFNYTLTFNYKLKEKFYVGTDLWYSQFQYNSKTLGDLIFFKFKINTIASDFYFKYIFRDKVGLRPNIKAGIGYVHSSRPQSKVSILDIGDGENAENYLMLFSLKEKNYSYGHVLFSVGIDYLPGQQSNWTVGMFSNFFQGIENPKIIGSRYFQMGINLGLIF